jgi:LmeA-like phospholipid-binding
MSDEPTRPWPGPQPGGTPPPGRDAPPGPPPASAPPGQPPVSAPPGRRRWPYIVAGSVLAVIALLVVLDRAAVAYAQHRIAQQITSHGFPREPAVTVEGFPFLTQVARRDLDGIRVRSSGLREGPVTVSLDLQATDIRLNPGYGGGTIGRVNGTGIVGFASIASLASIAGAPGMTVSAAGPDAIKLTANLDVVSASAIAKVTTSGPGTFHVHVVSADGLPASLLGPVSDFTVHVPRLPLGLRIQRVNVTGHGIAVHVTGAHVPFGQ